MMEYLNQSVRSLRQRKSRTALTLLGIVIGVAVIVAMVSIGVGMQFTIDQRLAKIGGDKISVFPAGVSFGMGPPQDYTPFSQRELDAVEQLPGVDAIAARFIRTGTVEFRGEKQDTTIHGIKGLNIFSIFYSLQEGRYFRDEETDVVNIGYKISKDFFGDKPVKTGDILKINGKNFRVVGIYNELGTRADDTGIYMPMKAAQSLFGAESEITVFLAVAEDERRVSTIAAQIEDLLEKIRGAKDFEVMPAEQLAARIGSIITIITFVLGGIASVSLLVGGVIIMNTMLMSVMERTREIGVMKATGATSRLILQLFLAESGIIGLVGGVAGVIFGLVLSKIIEVVGRIYIGGQFITVITPEMIGGALLFSLLVGCLSGAYPAYKAAKLDPVVALRYE